MAPDELEDALLVADLGTGELPHWHRGKGDAEPCADLVSPEVERALEAAKHAPWPPAPEPDGEGEGK